ncbi:carotenoid biosynthesis protein [Fodinicola acaciae]|uniref:carotenoid biosynthesis protein n=1 Tax=Fodinicola acaciae TaxID=2681555 RepID=UPI0013D347AF|nr:carotenoid biosynthesis protein [Fodinicola acaciae]
MTGWLAAATVLAQIGYPLTSGTARNVLTVVTVLLFAATSIVHAGRTQGWSYAARFVAITAGGGFLVEVVGVAFGIPFGSYVYADTLGPRLFGVPLVIPLAWTMMAWPSWLVAGRLVRSRWLRVLVAGWALASWDVFLDPQMVAAGHWRWLDPSPSLPGISAVPLTNYVGWMVVAVALMALLSTQSESNCNHDGIMMALYLWTYGSSVLAHAVFLGLPASALAGGIAMGTVAIPLAVKLVRS